MNIQIFGTKKSFDTKKAQRWFKERRIKFQFIDLKEKEMSKGELRSVCQATGGIDAVLDPKAKDEDTLALVQNLAESQRFDKLLENQQLLREPIVRNGRAATVGYAPRGLGYVGVAPPATTHEPSPTTRESVANDVACFQYALHIIGNRRCER